MMQQAVHNMILIGDALFTILKLLNIKRNQGAISCHFVFVVALYIIWSVIVVFL